LRGFTAHFYTIITVTLFYYYTVNVHDVGGDRTNSFWMNNERNREI